MMIIVSGCLGTSVQAQSLDTLKSCARISGESERLACYDTAVAAIDATLAAELATRKREAEARAMEAKRLAAIKAEQDKIDSFGAGNLPKASQPASMTATADEIKAKIDTILSTGYDRIVVMLDNGQIWSQTEGKSLGTVKPGDEVEVKRGALGSYRMRLLRLNRVIQVLRKK